MHKFLYGIFVLLMLVACNNSPEVQMTSVGGSWNKKKEHKFNLQITDAQTPKNIIFVVRNTNDYPYSNIRFIVNLTDQKNKNINKDTLNYILAKPNGEWIGTGFGKTKEIYFQYRTNYKFPKNGNYTIGINQAMRHDNLPGIEDVGVLIEPIKP